MASLPNAPLVYMVGMVRFPKVPDIAKFIPAFHESVRSSYPLASEIVAKGVNARVGPGGGEIEQVVQYLWQFATADKSFAFILGDEFLCLHTARYHNHTDFAGKVEEGLSKLLAVQDVGITLALSVGIRYINLIVPRSGETLEQYVKPTLLALDVLGKEQSLTILEGMAVSGFATPLGALRVQVLRNPPSTIVQDLDTPLIAENGWKPTRPDVDFVVLDIDHGARMAPPEPIDVTRVKDKMIGLRNAASGIFHSATTEYAQKVWGEPA